MTGRFIKVLAVVLACIPGAVQPAVTPASGHEIPRPRTGSAPSAFFVENVGQWDDRVRFVAQGDRTMLAIEDDRVVVAPARGAAGGRVSLAVRGAVPTRAIGEGRVSTVSHFLLGDQPEHWRTHVPGFERVRSARVLPGVDVVWHTAGTAGLEYDLELEAGIAPTTVEIEIEGASSLAARPDGGLDIGVDGASLVQAPARVTQAGRNLAARYVVRGPNRVGFAIDQYDPSEPILIDPVLEYSTYLGGSLVEGALAITRDSAGKIYVLGTSTSTNFPTVGPYQATNAGIVDAVISVFNSAGTALVASTYLGGAANENPRAIGLDGAGNVYVAGTTDSKNFPTTNWTQAWMGNGDGFLTKLDPTASSIVFSTYFGGTGPDGFTGLVVDASGNSYLAGTSGSAGGYIVKAAYQPVRAGATDGTLTKFDANGALVFSTYLGGALDDSISGLALDATGNIYVTGPTSSTDFPVASALQGANAGGLSDGFITKMTPNAAAVVYSTYLGGTALESPSAIAVDAAGEAIIAGQTTSTNYPTANAPQSVNGGGVDAFVTKLNAAGSALAYSTYIGGSGTDAAQALAITPGGVAYAAGITFSTNFPTKSPYQGSCTCSSSPIAFLTELAPAGGLTSSTYFGSVEERAFGLFADPGGGVWMVGSTKSPNLPLATPFQSVLSGTSDAFIAKFGAGPLALGAASTPPKGSLTLAATGGAGGYVYGFQSNASGGTLNPSTGAYVAGATGSVNDVVKVTDGANAVATATITVGPGLSVSPSSPSVTAGGKVAFTASGGSGVGVQWSLPVNGSGATIGGTGNYQAGSTPNTLDQVMAVDSLGNSATTSITVTPYPTLSILPASPSVSPLGAIAFSAQGGSGGGYLWSLVANPSGGSIQSTTGAYQAGAIGGVNDVVKVVDSASNSASLFVVIEQSDAGPAVDAAVSDAATDTSAPADAAASDDAAPDAGVVGPPSPDGCSCVASGVPVGASPAGLGTLLLVVVAAVRRRRRG